MRCFAARLRSVNDRDTERLGTTVEQLCAVSAATPAPDEAAIEFQPAPRPAPVGCATVLDELKRHVGILPRDPPPATTDVGPDQFPLHNGSPLRKEHETLSALLEEVLASPRGYYPDFKRQRGASALLKLKPAPLGRMLLAAVERHAHAQLSPAADYHDDRLWRSRTATGGLVLPLLQQPFALSREACFDLLLYFAARPSPRCAEIDRAINHLLTQVEREAENAALSEGERYVLWLLRAARIAGPPLGTPSEDITRLTRLIADGAVFILVPGDAWSDAVNDALSRLPRAQREQWIALLRHALSATAARPSAKWLKTARALLETLGPDETRRSLARWLPLVAEGPTLGRLGEYVGDVRGAAAVINAENATCLRGLLWTVQALPRREELTRAIASVALSAYKKVPGVGPRAVKVGNAAVYALSEMGSEEAVGQLAVLKVRVKFGTAQQELEKAYVKSAERLGLPRDQIEEMGVPSYGLEEVGVRCEEFGGYRAELTVTGSGADVAWRDAAGKPLKSVPAKVKTEHKEDWKELQQSLKDIRAMLPAQRDRMDAMFLAQKTWPLGTWRERYLDHPLVGTIARRLLWCVDGTAALFAQGQATDAHGDPVAHGKTAEIALWHPIGRPTAEVLAWRQRLEALAIVQPFKQAHREVYLLTDAERNTRTYSNRFAAHIIRQHQFNALCAARGWKNKLRLMVDDAYPPATRELPQWGLRAEFWIEGVGQEPGADTNDAGVFWRLATDQVRFYRAEAATSWAHACGGGYESAATGPGEGNLNEPLPLDQIPALVFSEIMRDVDLFVGVASVGNDPAWQDGGPQGRYREYWQSYSFGELSGTAATRKQVLERLVPRLKIADRCSFSDRFLVVRGHKRTYKIHLGSSNILMEPNDQYLCIVPDARARAAHDDLYLPFEGDAVLSVILSKALLLADDKKIADPTIVRQIDHG
jgi:hypothetical protein